MGRTHPVSYTHLDVYKRQEEMGSGTGLRPSPWSGDDDEIITGTICVVGRHQRNYKTYLLMVKS